MAGWHDLYYLSEWVIRLVMLIYVPQRRSTSDDRAWLLLIFLLPWPGLIVYAFIGRPFLPGRRLAMQQQVSEFVRYQQALLPNLSRPTPALAPAINHVVTLAQRLGDFNILGDNRIELLDDYQN